MKHAVEIILTLSATFKGSADQQSVDAKTDFAFLGHDNLFSQIYMTRPEGQTQVIARAQSISLIHCLFRLMCKFTEPLYKSAWCTLLSLLIFSTYALSIKREGRNLPPPPPPPPKKGNIAVAAFLCGYARYRDSPISDPLIDSKDPNTIKAQKRSKEIVKGAVCRILTLLHLHLHLCI